jgi:hypothetical protein
VACKIPRCYDEHLEQILKNFIVPGYSGTGISLFPVASANIPPSIPNMFEGNLITESADAPVGTVD